MVASQIGGVLQGAGVQREAHGAVLGGAGRKSRENGRGSSKSHRPRAWRSNLALRCARRLLSSTAIYSVEVGAWRSEPSLAARLAARAVREKGEMPNRQSALDGNLMTRFQLMSTLIRASVLHKLCQRGVCLPLNSHRHTEWLLLGYSQQVEPPPRHVGGLPKQRAPLVSRTPVSSCSASPPMGFLSSAFLHQVSVSVWEGLPRRPRQSSHQAVSFHRVV